MNLPNDVSRCLGECTIDNRRIFCDCRHLCARHTQLRKDAETGHRVVCTSWACESDSKEAFMGDE